MWSQLLARARVDLSMGWEELSQCAPRFFECMAQRLKMNVERYDRARDFMLAQIAAEVANSYGHPRYKEWRKPVEFLPAWQRPEGSKRQGSRPPRKPRMTRARQAALALQLREAFMHFVEK